MSEGVAGRVLGTEDATPLEFWVAVGPGEHLQLDDVVALDRALPDGETVTIYGIVSQVRARHEGARFDTDVFLIADGVLPAEVSEAAQVQLTRVEPEIFVPPLPGHRGAAGHRRRAGRGARLRRRRAPAAGRAVAATTSRSTSTSTSSTAPRAPTSTSPASPASPPRPATPPSCSTRCSHSGVLGAERGQHQGADLQRQGRGPAVPRPPQHRSSTTTSAARYAPPRPAGRPVPSASASSPRPARATRTPRPTPAPASPGSRRSSGRIAEFCRAAAAAVPVRRRRGRAPAVHDRRPVGHRPAGARRPRPTPATARCASTARLIRTFRQLVDADRGQADPRRPRRARRPALDRPGDRRRHDQRLHPPAGVGRAPRRAPDPRRHRRRRHRTRSTSTPTRSPSSTSTCSTTGPSGSSSASCCARRSRPRRRRAPPSRCSSSCSTSSTSTRPATRPARSRRSCSTSPSAAAPRASS